MRFIYSKVFIVFAGLIVLLVLLMFLQTKGLIEPIKKGFIYAPKPVATVARMIFKPFRSLFSTVYRLDSISKENTELQNKINGLEQNLVDYEGFQRENEVLRQELGFVKKSGFELVPCSVLAESPFSEAGTVVINCGKEKGVGEGLAVISQGHLAGKIIYSSKTVSTVLLVTASQFSSDAKLVKTNASAIVKGSFGSGIFLDQLSQNQDLNSGWLVATAGIDKKVPKDILIGEVGEMLSSSSDLFKRATVITPVDFDNLEFVFVVK